MQNAKSPSANQVNVVYEHLKIYGVSRWDAETALKRAMQCDPYPWKKGDRHDGV